MCVSIVGTVGTTLPSSVGGVRPMKAQGRGVSDPAEDVRAGLPVSFWGGHFVCF